MADLASQWDSSGFGAVQTGLQRGQIQADIVRDGQRHVEDVATRQMRRAIGGDLTWRNYPRRGQTSRAKIKSTQSGDSGTIKFQPAGMWAIVEEGSRPHRIAGRTRRIVIPVRGQWKTGPFQHPGTRSLGTPIADATRDLADELEDSAEQQIDRRF